MILISKYVFELPLAYHHDLICSLFYNLYMCVCYIWILTYTLWDYRDFYPLASAISDNICCHIRPRLGVVPGYLLLVSNNKITCLILEGRAKIYTNDTTHSNRLTNLKQRSNNTWPISLMWVYVWYEKKLQWIKQFQYWLRSFTTCIIHVRFFI